MRSSDCGQAPRTGPDVTDADRRMSLFRHDDGDATMTDWAPPFQVGYVNFTWSSGRRRYNYNFFELTSDDNTILMPPIVSIKRNGRVPKKARSKC